MMTKVAFCFVSVCSRKTIGIGKHRTMTSVSMLDMPLAREKGMRLKHFGSCIDLSQKAAIGTHSKRPAKNKPAHHMKTSTPAPYIAYLYASFLLKMR